MTQELTDLASRPPSFAGRGEQGVRTVLKVGGGTDIPLDAVMTDVADWWREGHRLVLVHGAAATLNEVATRLGHPPEFLTSPSGHVSRRTDRRTLEIFEMVYCGQVNKGIVERLQRHGVNAVGLSGLDGRIWEGPRKDAVRAVKNDRQVVVRDDYTGRVDRVNVPLLRTLLDADLLPVLSPPAASYDGEAINVDGDRAAARTAAALGSETLVILSNVPGLLARFPDEASLIHRIPAAELEDFMAVAEDRMKKKVLGAQEALAGGVRRVIFGDARLPRPLHRALAGTGTVIGD
jgi:acetylglutamate/LysW-gamma-L-alpha-aminoadipate kinase